MTIGGWLEPGSGSEGDPQEAAQKRVKAAAEKLKNPLLPQVAGIYSEHLFDSGLADEWQRPAERFIQAFRGEQMFLNEGVDPLDFVRECVRRSFGIASIIPFGPEGQKKCWHTAEQIEKIAVDLVDLGYVLPPKA